MKKKKKSVHIRRIRTKSNNKTSKSKIKNFFKVLDIIYKNNNVDVCFYGFLISFIAISSFKVKYMFKVFGINKYYRLKRQNNLNYFYILFKRKYENLQRSYYVKKCNVENKKKLYLHVSYRHYLMLPVRGQRTRTNAKTRKHYGII